MMDQFVEDNDIGVPSIIPGSTWIQVELVEFISRPAYGVDL
jgi:hypothetical protein